MVNSEPGPSTKRQVNGRQQFQNPIATFVGSQAGNWPASGYLFPDQDCERGERRLPFPGYLDVRLRLTRVP